MYTEYNLNIDHVRCIQKHYIFVLENIDPKYSGLIDRLYAKQVIDMAELDRLETEESVVRRIEKLLSILCRKPEEQFRVFLASLDESNQRHVADQLRGIADGTIDQGQAGQHQAIYDSTTPAEIINESYETLIQQLNDELKGIA